MIKFKAGNIFIGIDVGASTIKAVEIEVPPTGAPVLRKTNLVKTSEGIKKALSGMSAKEARVIGVVDCPVSCVRYITVPVMSSKELAEAIKWEAKDKIPFPLDKAIVDFEVCEEMEEAGVKKLRVKIAASPSETIDNFLRLLSEVSIEPISLIQPPIAFEHLSRRLNFKSEQAIAIIDIGCEVTTINIIKNSLLKFHRKMPSGSSLITKAMIGTFNFEEGRIEINEENAEKIKLQYGIPKEDATFNGKKLAAAQLRSLIRPALERLLNEIERSLEYYRHESDGDRVSSIILCGGGAQLKGLGEFLQESLGVSVSGISHLEGINVAKGALKDMAQAQPGRYAVALGAALSEGKEINLLPKELKEKTKRTIERAGIEAVVAAVVAILILTYIGMQLQIASYNKKITAGNLESKAVLPQLELASNYERYQDEILRRQSLINGILNNTPLWNEIFKELSNIVPKEIVLTEMRMENNTLVMKGEISGTGRDREEILSNYISALERGMFKHVSLLSAKIGEAEKGKAEFEIKCVCSIE